jgi:hypothetical protein
MTRFAREIANKISNLKNPEISEKEIKVFTINFLQIMHNFRINKEICDDFSEKAQEPLKNKEEIVRISLETLKTIEEKSKSTPPKHGAWK